jgi:GT2 family glycosyltransferase
VDAEVAVVVATHDRADQLERLLDALAAQRDAPPFEVVVVDDASSDDTWARLSQRAAVDPVLHLHPLRQELNQGPAAARNRGWRASRASVVAFTDDDCIPGPHWLASLTAAVSAGADIAQGRTEPVVAQRPGRGPFSMTIEKLQEDGFYETCNMAYRREVLEAVGGFDEAFLFPYGEDTDLAWRARKSGATTAFVDRAVVEHEIWPFSWRSRVNDVRRREGMNLLLAKHPELRSLFPSPWFQKPTHPRAVSALAGVLALATRPRSALRWTIAVAAVWWYFSAAAPERVNVRRRDWPWVLPLCLASDLADVASLARGSIRQRALFL